MSILQLKKILTALFSPTKQAVYGNDGCLRIPKVKISLTGKEHDVVMRLISEDPLRFEVSSIEPPLPFTANAPPPSMRKADFRCNICGTENRGVAQEIVSNREAQSCSGCGSSLRMRSLINTLATALFHKPLSLPEFPRDKTLFGLGMSDWEGYALPLAEKLAYTNTFYHTEPRLDILNPPPEWKGRCDFIISSDVFEHIPPPVSPAFQNVLELLKPGGVFIFTVPYTNKGETTEHFPELHDFELIEEGGRKILLNRTVDGREQRFDDLIFHGGEGFTLEMRLFSEPDLRRELNAAGFENIRIHHDDYPAYGIIHVIDWALPISTRRPL